MIPDTYKNDNVVELPKQALLSTDRFSFIDLGNYEARTEPELFIPGILLKGKTHHFYGASNTGKSWVALWCAAQAILYGHPVLYLDLENGPDTTKERMNALGVSDELLSALFLYAFNPVLNDDKESREWFEYILKNVEPGLIVFDSWLGFLSLAGLSEDSNDDLEKWAGFYLATARSLGWTVLLLDHTGHQGDHARGASRKQQVVEVQYHVKLKGEGFDRTKTGAQTLTQKKDRLAWLPPEIRVTLGGSPFKFEMNYEGVQDSSDWLPDRCMDALRALKSFGWNGATYKEWESKSGLRSTTFERHRKRLIADGYANHNGEKYYITENGMSKATTSG